MTIEEKTGIISAVISGIGVIASLLSTKLQIAAQRKKELKDKLHALLPLFDRRLFKAGLEKEDPIKMLKAITEVRISLQIGGALSFPDKHIQPVFERIHQILADTEDAVEEKFPHVYELSQGDGYGDSYYGTRREYAQRYLGQEYYNAVSFMMNIRSEIEQQLSILRSI